MILTVTLNAAVDKTYRLNQLMTGQVNRVKELMSFPGGKGINVTRVLRLLGKETLATGVVGGYTGDYIVESLKEQNIDCDFVYILQNTRCNMNIIGEDGYITEILEPGPLITSTETEKFLLKYVELLKKCDKVVLSGSVCQGIDTDIYGRMILTAKRLGKKTFLDTSGEYLIEGMKEKPFFIKPNLKELEYALGEKLTSEEQVAEAAGELYRNGIENVVVTMGKKGMIVANSSGIFRSFPPKIKVRNTVGCGDSVVASYAAFVDSMESEELLIYATAVSTANTMTLENGSIEMEYVEELKKQVKTRRISINSN